ncbi:acetylornithine deacetylase [Litoribacillus peritrichatus]
MKLPALIDRMSTLIALPSVSCTHPDMDMSNLPVIEALADWFERMGFAIEIQHVPNQPGKANLIATLGSGPGGLVLSGHTDTVPFNENRWNSNPLKLDQRDNKLYGLGTCDMKGFFSVVIEAVLPYLDKPLQQPLIVLATADEESSMSGARALAQQGYPKARYAVIGEPTSLKPIHMHKGIMMEVVRIQGKAGHSSNPDLGNNALEAMHSVMGELISFRQELASNYQNADFQVSVPTLNLGCIHGGDNPNRICGHCELQYDLRALPGMSNDDLRESIRQRLIPLGEQFNVKLTSEALFDGVPSFASEKTSEMVQLAEKLTGHDSEAVAFATEAPFLQQMGMDTIVLGPGSIDQAHQPDEFMALDQINPMVDVLRGMIENFCLQKT